MSIVILFFVLATAVIVGDGFRRGRRSEQAVRRAGIGPDRPGCPSCLYPLGGWSGPRCPECGTDVAEAGVRFQSECRQRRWLAVATVATLWIGLPSVGLLAGFLAAAGDESFTSDAQSECDPGVRVRLEVEHAWSRVPPRSRRSAGVELFDTAGATGTVKLLDGRPTGLAGLRATAISFDQAPPPMRAEIQDRVWRGLSELTEGRLSDEDLSAHAAAIAIPLDAALRLGIGSDVGRPKLGLPFINAGWGMSRGVNSGALRPVLAMVGTLAAVLAMLVCVRRAVQRRTSDGLRACEANEWASAN